MGELSTNPTLGKTNGSCVAQQRKQVEKAFSHELLQDSAPCQKLAKRDGFVGAAKTDGRRGTFEVGLQDACRAAPRMIWPHFCIVCDPIQKASLPSPGGFFIFPDQALKTDP